MFSIKDLRRCFWFEFCFKLSFFAVVLWGIVFFLVECEMVKQFCVCKIIAYVKVIKDMVHLY